MAGGVVIRLLEHSDKMSPSGDIIIFDKCDCHIGSWEQRSAKKGMLKMNEVIEARLL